MLPIIIPIAIPFMIQVSSQTVIKRYNKRAGKILFNYKGINEGIFGGLNEELNEGINEELNEGINLKQAGNKPRLLSVTFFSKYTCETSAVPRPYIPDDVP